MASFQPLVQVVDYVPQIQVVDYVPPVHVTYTDLNADLMSMLQTVTHTVTHDQDADIGADAADEVQCQDFWYATPEGDCVPEQGMVQTECHGNTMSIKFDPRVLGDGQDIDAAYVGEDKIDQNCMPVNTPDGYELTFGLDNCGTTLSYDEESETLKYTAEMVIPPKMQGFIYFDQQMSWTFTCSYSTKYDVTDEVTIATSVSKQNFEAQGSFDVDLSFYQTENFENVAEDEPFMIGKPVHFGITFNGGVPLKNLVFVPGNCEVINLENTEEFFQVWNSGYELEEAGMCDGNLNPVNFEVLQSPNDQSAFYGMQYRGFAFGSVSGSSGEQQLKCLVNVCHVDVCNSACTLGCFATPENQCDEGSGESDQDQDAEQDAQVSNVVSSFVYPSCYPNCY